MPTWGCRRSLMVAVVVVVPVVVVELEVSTCHRHSTTARAAIHRLNASQRDVAPWREDQRVYQGQRSRCKDIPVSSEPSTHHASVPTESRATQIKAIKARQTIPHVIDDIAHPPTGRLELACSTSSRYHGVPESTGYFEISIGVKLVVGR